MARPYRGRHPRFRALTPGSMRHTMTGAITAGSILIEEGTHLPNSLLLQSESCSNGWASVKNTRSTLEKEIQEAGWTFFFMAGEIRSTVFGFDKQKTLRAALKRLIAIISAIHGSDLWRTRWSLRNHFRSRCRRDGRGVSRTRYETRPHGRDQDSSGTSLR